MIPVKKVSIVDDHPNKDCKFPNFLFYRTVLETVENKTKQINTTNELWNDMWKFKYNKIFPDFVVLILKEALQKRKSF